MTGKALSALLATLRRAGVVEYETTALRLRLAPDAAAIAPARDATAGKDVDVPDDDPPPRDWRFALEDLSNLNAKASRGKLT